jgi:hypothetical protein
MWLSRFYALKNQSDYFLPNLTGLAVFCAAVNDGVFPFYIRRPEPQENKKIPGKPEQKKRRARNLKFNLIQKILIW